MFSNHFIDWAILITLIFIAIYTMVIIGGEGKTYKEESKLINFFTLAMNTPKWWAEKEKTDDSLTFHRADTFYEWAMKVSKIKTEDINEYLSDYIDREEIIYDEEETRVETDSPNKVLVKETNDKIHNFIYVEGTATEKINSRIYLELVLIQLKDGNVYFFENKSSVLNGAIEGPYFDELIKSLEISS